MKRYPHVHRFVDRHGKTRAYLREPGKQAVSLPPDIGSAGFDLAYRAAISAEGARPKRRRVAPKANPIENLLPKMPKVGVYLLFDAQGDLTYIGSSMNLPERIATHRANGREFSSVRWIPTTPGDRLSVERSLIRAMLPKQNKAHTSKPLSRDRLAKILANRSET